MKRLLLCFLALLLLLSGCAREREDSENEPFRIACFECEKKFEKGQINTDFGLCPNCMMKVGAAYCQNCKKPCYTRDMVQGLCLKCQSVEPEQSEENTSAATQETAAGPETRECKYCAGIVASEYIVEDACVGCYSVRLGKCLRCLRVPHYYKGSHCESCRDSWYNCKKCGQYCAGSEMFMDICADCYLERNGFLVPCSFCLFSFLPNEIDGGYCKSCFAQAHWEEMMPTEKPEGFRCTACGREYDTPDDLYEGKCWSCYNEDKDLCISCRKRPSEGLGPSAMECAECYYESNATCPGCGYDYWKDDMVNGYCHSCARDGMPGIYYADNEKVKITVTRGEDVDYLLAYSDLAAGITLKNIPLAYYDTDTEIKRVLVFLVEPDAYGYSGYVKLCMEIGARADYSYSALVGGLEDTLGDYAPLTRG